MKLLLQRKYKKANYTIGDLYIDGKWFSNTLEDRDRGLTQDMDLEDILRIKVYGETAIPTGTYRIDMNTISPKFKDRSWAKPYKGKIPRLLNVPGFDGVLLHPGNSANDSLGCVLVGNNTQVGKVLNSQAVFKRLMQKLLGEQDITLTIE